MSTQNLLALPAAVRVLAVATGVALLLAGCAELAQPAAEAETTPQRIETLPEQEPDQPPLISVPARSVDWVAPDGDEEAARQAYEQCVAYARAVVAHDSRIESDRDLTRRGGGSSTRSYSFARQMREHDTRVTFERRLASCMAARGFEPQ